MLAFFSWQSGISCGKWILIFLRSKSVNASKTSLYFLLFSLIQARNRFYFCSHVFFSIFESSIFSFIRFFSHPRVNPTESGNIWKKKDLFRWNYIRNEKKFELEMNFILSWNRNPPKSFAYESMQVSRAIIFSWIIHTRSCFISLFSNGNPRPRLSVTFFWF